MTTAHPTLPTFRSEDQVLAYFDSEIRKNGTPQNAGVEEEIIVLDRNGKAIPHEQFQIFSEAVISSLPGGVFESGPAIGGGTVRVLKGRCHYGLIQPETNTTLVELAHTPRATAWGIHEQSKKFAAHLSETAQNNGLIVMGSGAVPTMSWEDFHKEGVVIPNAAFSYSYGHMKQRTRETYCRTVFGTASVHHNMGFNDPEKMATYLTTSLRAQPTMIALLGNSPLWNGSPAKDATRRPLLSYRSYVQLSYGSIFGMEGAAYLYPDFLLNPNSTFESLVRGYMNLPLDRTIAGTKKVSCGKMTMREYLENGFKDGERRVFPNTDSLTMMLREPIVDVRPNMCGAAPRVETRAHDCVSSAVSVAVDAFYRGLAENLDEAKNFMKDLPVGEIRRQRLLVCYHGLATRITHPNHQIRTQGDMAERLLSLSRQGLERRGLREEVLLQPLEALCRSRENPAQKAMHAWHGRTSLLSYLQTQAYEKNTFADGSSAFRNEGIGSRQRRTVREQQCAL